MCPLLREAVFSTLPALCRGSGQGDGATPPEGEARVARGDAGAEAEGESQGGQLTPTSSAGPRAARLASSHYRPGSTTDLRYRLAFILYSKNKHY